MKRAWLFFTCIALLLACAHAREDAPRYGFDGPREQALAAGKIVLAPLSVVQEFAPGGDELVDPYLAGGAEVWQPFIEGRLKKESAGRKVALAVVSAPAPEFRARLAGALGKRGVDGFFDADTGRFDDGLYLAVLGDVAASYGTPVLVPRVVKKNAGFGRAWWNDVGSPKAKWDGVSRKVETGGSRFFRILSMQGGISVTAYGRMMVLSLHVDLCGPSGRLFWADGGFDTCSRLSYGTMGFGGAKESKKKGGHEELFSKKNQDNMAEAAEKALESMLEKE